MDIYKFKLYVVEDTPTSQELIKRLGAIFNHALKDNYKLEIVDIIKYPEIALSKKVIATPTLVMEFPVPPKRIVGNIGDKDSILIRLDLLSDLNG